MKSQVSNFHTVGSSNLDKSSKCKNEKKKAITSKLGKAELRFLCTALLLNEIYLPTKFLVETSCSFRVMSWTRCGQTDGHTDGRSGDYIFSGSISVKVNMIATTSTILTLEVFVVNNLCKQKFQLPPEGPEGPGWLT